MHDIILANQIIAEIKKVAKERGIGKIKKVKLEIGSVALAHDGFPEHADDINVDNLKFLLESIVPKYGLNKVIFDIKKSAGDSWRILEIITK